MKWCTIEWNDNGERYRCTLPEGHDPAEYHESIGSSYVGYENQSE